MHELIIANKILEDLKKYAPLKDISSVNFEVGELAHITGEELTTALQGLMHFKGATSNVKGKNAEGKIAERNAKSIIPEGKFAFKINIIKKKAKARCSCSYVGEPKLIAREHDFVVFECKKCGKVPTIIEGGDIKIKEIKTKCRK